MRSARRAGSRTSTSPSSSRSSAPTRPRRTPSRAALREGAPRVARPRAQGQVRRQALLLPQRAAPDEAELSGDADSRRDEWLVQRQGHPHAAARRPDGEKIKKPLPRTRTHDQPLWSALKENLGDRATSSRRRRRGSAVRRPGAGRRDVHRARRRRPRGRRREALRDGRLAVARARVAARLVAHLDVETIREATKGVHGRHDPDPCPRDAQQALPRADQHRLPHRVRRTLQSLLDASSAGTRPTSGTCTTSSSWCRSSRRTR